MLDFGWMELFIIMGIAVLALGPNEIPKVMLTLGRLMRRLNYVRYAISQQFEDVMRDADMNDIGRSVNFEAPKEQDFDEAEADKDDVASDTIEAAGDAMPANEEVQKQAEPEKSA